MKFKLEDFNEDVQKKIRVQLSVSAANVEPTSRNESLGKKKITRLDTPCRIHINSRRKRLADCDGISAKALIDGLFIAGILQNDSPKWVKEVSYSQTKSDIEETIVTIDEI